MYVCLHECMHLSMHQQIYEPLCGALFLARHDEVRRENAQQALACVHCTQKQMHED
jgi:hypothetical protein